MYITVGSPLTVNRYSSTLLSSSSPLLSSSSPFLSSSSPFLSSSSSLLSSSSSATSSTPDYLCLHRFCNYRSKWESELERHMTKHFPSPSSKMFDCPTFGCDRIGDLGFRRKDKLNEHIRNSHHQSFSREERAASLSRKRRASTGEEDTPRLRTKCFRAVMAPDIFKAEHDQFEVSRGTNLKLNQ